MKPSLTIPMPRVDAGFAVSFVAVASLVAVAVAIGFLTDWRWGLLAGGLIFFSAAFYVSRNLPVEEQAENVTPIKKAS